MVETTNLKIIPLNPAELECYLGGEDRLEKSFNLKASGRRVSPAIKERIIRTILPQLRAMEGSDYLYSTFWIVVEKASSAIVAELGFKNNPDQQGNIEIGYGSMPAYRGRGIMTEAVAGMIQWARSVPEIHAILAETDKDNAASIRVLEKNNFVPFDLRENMRWWKINLSEL
jgi:ribosomal-protein-alanine N-acetyltransferase